ncbi:hypothetical protein BDY19DRAFT_990440 [Irpex rosettiformis]|uniref:Uncharacterized protein n=1 Tax=Irpex rosettiformis TaxID=378272 RepID=A0ACB8UEG5_9APHY|nr:hypothetical protein BDY19DRAFT_990440 [Irpex rosettiformis]
MVLEREISFPPFAATVPPTPTGYTFVLNRVMRASGFLAAVFFFFWHSLLDRLTLGLAAARGAEVVEESGVYGGEEEATFNRPFVDVVAHRIMEPPAGKAEL